VPADLGSVREPCGSGGPSDVENTKINCGFMDWILFFWQKDYQSFWGDMRITLVIISEGPWLFSYRKPWLLVGPSICLCHRLKVADIAVSTWCCTTVFISLVVCVLSSTGCASAGSCWTDDPTAQTFHLVTSVCLTLSRNQWRAIDLDWVTVSRPWCLQWFQQQYRLFFVEVTTYLMVCW
jgi:hypothetical protein